MTNLNMCPKNKGQKSFWDKKVQSLMMNSI